MDAAVAVDLASIYAIVRWHTEPNKCHGEKPDDTGEQQARDDELEPELIGNGQPLGGDREAVWRRRRAVAREFCEALPGG
jgi:hypothetical protein